MSLILRALTIGLLVSMMNGCSEKAPNQWVTGGPDDILGNWQDLQPSEVAGEWVVIEFKHHPNDSDSMRGRYVENYGYEDGSQFIASCDYRIEDYRMIKDSCFYNIWDKDGQITHAGTPVDFGVPSTHSYVWKIVDGILSMDSDRGEDYDGVLERSNIPVIDIYSDDGVCKFICE